MTRIAGLIGILILLAAPVHACPFATTACGPAQAAVAFSPKGRATDTVVQALAGAQHSILVQAYTFTSAPIVDALLHAYRRGVVVQVVLDKSNATGRYSAATPLYNAGMPVWIDARHAIAHNKVMVIDDTTVLTGSFNFTKAAEVANAENLLVLTNAPAVIEAYRANFAAHLAHATAYTR